MSDAKSPIETFLGSLSTPSPPIDAAPLLHAVWHGLRGEWERAHAIVQELEGADAAWVHGWLHRIEGDPGNAGYWYRRAGRSMGHGDTTAEGQAIAAALLGRR
ncbi:hypothetical protein [Benzoatithermus flavus]|uniref:Uncharacterized protein n=1 Tax=Benzoatithermus flavus TaxID=3108223 RepID=A0ABU8XR14_9PROT